MPYSLRARMVFPVDRPPIELGVVTIEGERIVSVGAQPQATDVTNLGEVALLPGLVNAHTHLEFSHLRQPLGTPGLSLVDWIRLVLAERGRRNRDASVSVQTGMAECIDGGATTIGEISQGDANVYVSAAAELTLLLEVIGFSRSRAESALAAVKERLALLEAKSNLRLGLSPHAPYTISPELLQQLVALARRGGLPMAMHLAESAEELQFLASGTGPFRELLEERSMWDAEAIPRGNRPLDYLRMLSKAPRALVIHGNYLDEEERAFLADHAERMSLVYCPRTHAYFGHPPYPLADLLARGVRVALGTDSRASNPDLDLLAEMRFVAASHDAVDPLSVLRMGTLAGAEALGRGADLGSITPGKFANLVAVPLPNEAPGSPTELLNGILTSRHSPCAVWIHGARTNATAG